MVAQGLLHGLGGVAADDLDLRVLVYPSQSSWAEQFPHVSRGLVYVHEPRPSTSGRARARLSRVAGPLSDGLRRLDSRVRPFDASRQPRIDAGIETVVADLVHFVLQTAGPVSSPFIYQPHDLQHEHLPEFFTPRQIAYRRFQYGRMCERARTIVVASQWVKRDLVTTMKVDPERIVVIPLAPLDRSAMAAASTSHLLPKGFGPYALYSAAFWPHKNHLRLLDAMASLREAGKDVSLVLTGAHAGDEGAVRRAVRERGLQERVAFLGFVSDADLGGLLAGARCAVVPSLFEAGSFPVWEAMSSGTPVAASSVTSLPGQLGDAGVLFDPTDPQAIAQAWGRLWDDAELRERLRRMAKVRVASYTWELTARRYVALYRSALGIADPEGERLLAAPPTL